MTHTHSTGVTGKWEMSSVSHSELDSFKEQYLCTVNVSISRDQTIPCFHTPRNTHCRDDTLTYGSQFALTCWSHVCEHVCFTLFLLCHAAAFIHQTGCFVFPASMNHFIFNWFSSNAIENVPPAREIRRL